MSTIRVVNIQHTDATEPNIVLEADGTTVFASGITISGGTNLTVSGTAEFASGTVSAPGITFIDDNNTGIYEPAADTVAITTAATERLRIDSSGRLLVGDSSIFANANADDLQIGKTTTANVGLTIGSSTQGQLAFGDAGDARAGLIHYQHTDNSMRFYTSGPTNERMRIDSSGNVGIGTSSPRGLLHVGPDLASGATDAARINLKQNGLAATDGIYLERSGERRGYHMFIGGPNDGLTFRANNFGTFTTTMYLTRDGKVGIGTTSPNFTLDVSGTVGITEGQAVSWHNGSGSLAARIYASATDELRFERGSSALRSMTIDSSGRLLVGTTVAANQNNASGASARYPGAVFFNSTTNVNTRYTLQLTGASNAQGGPILGFSKTRSTTDSHTIIQNGDDLGDLQFRGSDGTHYVVGAKILAASDGTPGTNDMPGRLTFWTTADGASSPTERMRITAQGFIKASNTGSYVTSTSGTSATQHEISNSTDARDIIQFYNTHASNPYGIYLRFLNATPNNTTNYFLYCSDGTVQRVTLRSNGGIANYQSNNVNLCDEREKKNIETLDSTWGCLKNWELKKFHYNEDADTDDKRYGVIAQQVAPHCPEVITDWVKQKAEDAVLDEDGNVVTPAVEEVTRMGVKEQQMMWMAIKALQEAQARIETLEAKVAALEAE